MGRLKKLAEDNSEVVDQNLDQDFSVAIDLLNRINGNANDLKQVYYSLLENLNALNKDYAGVYNELKVMCKLPNKNVIDDIAQFETDMEKAVAMLSDNNFLSNFIK